LLLAQPFLQAQVVLNEVCTRNGTVLMDEDSAHSDWVELYNAGSSAVSLQNWALTDHPEEPFKWRFPLVQLAPGQFLIVFLSGNNRLSGELHTGFKFGSDEVLLLSDENGIAQDIFNAQLPATDHSWGCVMDGSNTHGYFTSPTPGTSNAASIAWPGYAEAPQFSLAPGFYSGSQPFEIISSDNQSTVYFTTDGNIPGSLASVYTSGFTLTGVSVVRAVAMKPGYLPSPVISGTYFIDFTSTLPVISITTDPALLFDPVTGLYMNGPNADPNFPHYGANWWLDTEIPIHLEYFSRQQQREVDQDAGLQIHGGSMSRNQPMKSLRILARKQYGKATVDYPLISDKPIESYKKFVLRNSSSDFQHTLFRDGMAQQLLLQEKLDIDVLGYEPCVVFINGAYWGIHNIREKIGPHYLEENHGADPENVDMMKEEALVEEGDSADFEAMYSYISSNDLSVDTTYQRVAGWLDLESFCDYIIAETYMNNNDWPRNNLKYWRMREPGAKWRYILFDLDVSFNGEPWSPVTLDWLGVILDTLGDSSRHTIMLKKLLNENDSFRNYFVNRYADLLNTSFTPETVRAYIAAAENRIAPEMPRHRQRWGGTMEQWHTEIDTKVIPFADDRQQIVRNQVEHALEPGHQMPLTLDVWPVGAGTIHLNTITPAEYPWSGIYYSDVPVTLTAIPRQGYHFAYWEGVESWTAPVKAIRITLLVSQATTVRAVYMPDGTSQTPLFVLPNPVGAGTPASALIYSEAGTVSWSLVAANGQAAANGTMEAAEAGWQKLTIPTDGLSSGVYFLSVTTGSERLTARLVIVADRE
jgi:hypothetical protein